MRGSTGTQLRKDAIPSLARSKGGRLARLYQSHNILLESIFASEHLRRRGRTVWRVQYSLRDKILQNIDPVDRYTNHISASQRKLISRNDARSGHQKGSVRKARSEEHTSELQSRQYLVCR